MKLQFDANQDYQLEAIHAVVSLFEGQPDASQISVGWDDELSSLKLTETGVSNQRVISDEQWLANLNAVQKVHGIEPSSALEVMKLDADTAVGAFPNFTVEMETGTGKTYVYLRTVYELSKNYGFKKFVIVVPSVAIREGVLKSLQITKEHFQIHYDYERVGFTVSYNPDWALAYRNDRTLYFVAETKKTGNGDHVRLDLLRPIEELRIECGKRHFKNFEEVQFKVVSSLTELVS